MTNPIIKIVNAETGEEIEREMNDEEFALYQDDQVEFQVRNNILAEAAEAKQALLARLGITADEAKLLLS